jgi:transcriptional regulator with XRE-family HTH domain
VTITTASEVGRRIALLRRRLGLSQAAFARQAGISRNALVEYERRDRLPKTAPVARIAEAGGTIVDWLLNGQARRTCARDDPEFEATVAALRTVWRDPTRRRLALALLTTLGQR